MKKWPLGSKFGLPKLGVYCSRWNGKDSSHAKKNLGHFFRQFYRIRDRHFSSRETIYFLARTYQAMPKWSTVGEKCMWHKKIVSNRLFWRTPWLAKHDKYMKEEIQRFEKWTFKVMCEVFYRAQLFSVRKKQRDMGIECRKPIFHKLWTYWLRFDPVYSWI